MSQQDQVHHVAAADKEAIVSYIEVQDASSLVSVSVSELESDSLASQIRHVELLPQTLNIYFQSSYFDTTTLSIGACQKEPLFKVVKHLDWKATEPGIVLHLATDSSKTVNGESPSVVAYMEKASTLDLHTHMTLPVAAVSECLVHDVARNTFTFASNVAGIYGLPLRRMAFQWRRWSSGWQLVSLAEDVDFSLPLTNSATLKTRQRRANNDAERDVAIVATFSSNWNWASSKVARFNFVGAGATGESMAKTGP